MELYNSEGYKEAAENPNERLEKALANATSIDNICAVIKNELTAGYIDNIDGGHIYSSESIIEAIKLAESEGTAEIPTLHKVPGLQSAVAEAIAAASN